MDLEHLRAFNAVADAGSLLGASKALDVSRGRLRASIRALEQELGVSLLTRSPRGVEPTEAGRDFMARSRQLLRDADELVRLTVESQQSVIDELRICLPTGIPPKAVQVILGLCRARYPQMALRLSTHPDPLAALGSAVDVVVHFGEPVTAGSFRTFVMRKFALRLMASPAYLDRRGRPGAIGDLRGHDLLLWTGHGAGGERLALPGAEGFEWAPCFSSTDCYVVRAAAEAGHGVGWLPEALSGAGGWPGAPLERVLPDAVMREQSVRVLLPERSADTARSRAVVAVLREVGGALRPSAR